MTKADRRAFKLALRAEITADYNKRFPRLKGSRLRNMVKQKADFLFAQQIRLGNSFTVPVSGVLETL